MNIHKCTTCNKSFNKKEKLHCHIANKLCKLDIYKCKLCNKSFTTDNSMYRHMKHNCKIKKKDDEEKNKIYEKLLKLEMDNLKLENDNKRLLKLEKTTRKIINENKKLKQEMKQLKTVKIVHNIKDNIFNVNNGIINHITLVGYGKEDISKLDKKDMLRVLQNGYNSTIKLAEVLHFNPKYPEYHNVYISNMKDKYAMMYDGTNWTLTIKDELINKIYDDKKNYIEENLDDFLSSLTPSRRKALERWLETDDSDSKIKEIKENIKLLLYNKRNIPLNTINDKKCIIDEDNATVCDLQILEIIDDVKEKVKTVKKKNIPQVNKKNKKVRANKKKDM